MSLLALNSRRLVAAYLLLLALPAWGQPYVLTMSVAVPIKQIRHDPILGPIRSMTEVVQHHEFACDTLEECEQLLRRSVDPGSATLSIRAGELAQVDFDVLHRIVFSNRMVRADRVSVHPRYEIGPPLMELRQQLQVPMSRPLLLGMGIQPSACGPMLIVLDYLHLQCLFPAETRIVDVLSRLAEALNHVLYGHPPDVAPSAPVMDVWHAGLALMPPHLGQPSVQLPVDPAPTPPIVLLDPSSDATAADEAQPGLAPRAPQPPRRNAAPRRAWPRQDRHGGGRAGYWW